MKVMVVVVVVVVVVVIVVRGRTLEITHTHTYTLYNYIRSKGGSSRLRQTDHYVPPPTARTIVFLNTGSVVASFP